MYSAQIIIREVAIQLTSVGVAYTLPVLEILLLKLVNSLTGAEK